MKCISKRILVLFAAVSLVSCSPDKKTESSIGSNDKKHGGSPQSGSDPNGGGGNSKSPPDGSKNPSGEKSSEPSLPEPTQPSSSNPGPASPGFGNPSLGKPGAGPGIGIPFPIDEGPHRPHNPYNPYNPYISSSGHPSPIPGHIDVFSMADNLAGIIDLLGQKTSVRDITKDNALTNYLNQNKVYVSLTTSPSRISKVHHVINSLDLTHVEKVFVSIPERFGRDNSTYEIPNELLQHPKVEILRSEQDYGPITKLIPGMQVLQKSGKPKDLLITIDDDTAYPKGMVNELIYHSVYSNIVYKLKTVIAGSGQDSHFWSLPRHFPNLNSRNNGQSCSGDVSFCDVVEGFSGIAYMSDNVDLDFLKKLSKISRSCYNSDDLVISFALAIDQVDRLKLRTDYLNLDIVEQLPYGFSSDALHRGAGFENQSQQDPAYVNAEKYQDCYQHLMKISMDPATQEYRTKDEIKRELEILLDQEDKKKSTSTSPIDEKTGSNLTLGSSRFKSLKVINEMPIHRHFAFGKKPSEEWIRACVERNPTFDPYLCNLDHVLSTQFEIRLLDRILKLSREILVRNQVNYWLDGGTLLGAYRFNQMIPYDDDLDIGAEAESFVSHLENIETQLQEVGLRMVNSGCADANPQLCQVRVDYESLKGKRLILSLLKELDPILSDSSLESLYGEYAQLDQMKHWQVPHLDFFLFRKVNTEGDGELYQIVDPYWNNKLRIAYPGGNRGFKSDVIFPLKTLTLMNESYPVPNRLEDYLAHWYGEKEIRFTWVLGNHNRIGAIESGPVVNAKDDPEIIPYIFQYFQFVLGDLFPVQTVEDWTYYRDAKGLNSY